MLYYKKMINYSLKAVTSLVESSERLIVEHLLAAEMKRNSNGFLFSLGSQYVEWIFKFSKEASAEMSSCNAYSLFNSL